MRSARQLVSFVSALVLVEACGGTPPPASKPPPAAAQGAELPSVEDCKEHQGGSPHAVEVHLLSERDGHIYPFCPGEPLTSSDALWVSVDLDSASHVRMVFVSPNGESGEVLMQDDVDVTRAAVFRAPSDLFARARGEAQLVIVASRGILGDADPPLAAMLDAIRDTGVVVERDGSIYRNANGASGLQELPVDLSSQALHAEFDARGVALVTLSLRTAP
jgi:hypothetical protein